MLIFSLTKATILLHTFYIQQISFYQFCPLLLFHKVNKTSISLTNFDNIHFEKSLKFHQVFFFFISFKFLVNKIKLSQFDPLPLKYSSYLKLCGFLFFFHFFFFPFFFFFFLFLFLFFYFICFF